MYLDFWHFGMHKKFRENDLCKLFHYQSIENKETKNNKSDRL